MRYLFEDFALDTDRRELRRGTVLVPIGPKVFDLLAYLIGNRDRVVTKDDLRAAIWSGRTVSPSVLTTCINAARSAIGDSGKSQRLIHTHWRKGLRFVGEIHQKSAGPTLLQLGTNVIASQSAEIAQAEVRLEPSALTHALPDRPSIAVLPFMNMSGDRELDYFADGIVEDIIIMLSHLRWLFVISRSSSFTYKGRTVDPKQLGSERGVRYVLEGSVRKSGQQVRITCQLIDATTDKHIWAERYDRELVDIFVLQDEITRSVAAAIEPRMLAAEGIRTLSRSTNDLDAWELVARALEHFWRVTRQDFQAATAMLTRAVDAHPTCASAQSLLGFSLVFAVHMGWIDPDQGLTSGRKHAVRAVGLDDGDPWAHIALGYLALIERHTAESIGAFQRAVSINPSSAAAHSHLSRALAFAGRDREALQHGEEAIQLNPLDPEMALFLGAIATAHYLGGRFAQAVQFTTKALNLRPGFQSAQRLLCASLAQSGRIDEARKLLEKVRLQQPLLSIDWVKRAVPYQTPELMEHFLDGMRRAGMAE